MDVKNLKINIKRFLAGAGVVFILASSAACAAKTSDCDIMPEHAHMYEKDGIVRYIDDEDLYIDGYKWSDEYRFIDESEVKEYKFAEKKDLISINDNYEYLEQYQKDNNKVIEYEYKEIVIKPIPHPISNGKYSYVIIIDEPVAEYHWTTDANHEGLTGKVRERSTEYIGYKIVEEGGHFKVEKSEPTDSLLNIREEYPYFKETSFKPVYNYDVQLESSNEMGK